MNYDPNTEIKANDERVNNENRYKIQSHTKDDHKEHEHISFTNLPCNSFLYSLVSSSKMTMSGVSLERK